MRFSTVLLLTTLAISIVMGSSSSSNIPDDADSWPVLDAKGFVKPYQVNGRWVNWWSRDKPTLFKFMTKFFSASDRSAIPNDDDPELARNLPVVTPYWLSDSNKTAGAPGIRATWIGHATVLAEVDSTLVLTDPIFSLRASAMQWIGPKRYRPPACTVAQLPDGLKAVVISHTHYDHLDYNSVAQLHARYGHGLHWFVPVDMGDWFRDNFDINNVHELLWWEEERIPGTNTTIILTPSNHWGRRTAFDLNKALWGSWVVSGPQHKFWFGGDTAYAEVFEQIGRRYGPFNLAAIPIGAYEPRDLMRHHHVNPEEAVNIHTDISSRQSFGIHWATFKLTYEFYMEPRARLLSAVEESGLKEGEFQAVDIGSTVEGRQ